MWPHGAGLTVGGGRSGILPSTYRLPGAPSSAFGMTRPGVGRATLEPMSAPAFPRRDARFWRQLWQFTRGQAACCTFAFAVVGLLALSRALPLGAWGLARYDFLLLGCLLVQGALLALRFETPREAGVILLFHALGFTLEAFKVAHGSWAYPEDALSKVLGVPLYAGFMYASVGSYMTQAWRRFGLALEHAPPLRVQGGLAAAAYLNFFTHHFGPDLRYVVTAALLLAYRRTRAAFTVGPERYTMPLGLAFALIGGFVFLAENAATRLGAWVYPHQSGGWQPVHLAKWLAWTLMVVVAFLIVSGLKRWEERGRAAHTGVAAPPPLSPAKGAAAPQPTRDLS
ncbi:hypothetical protein DAERI_110147 [Deinococcus aerius]|uniref:Integral membrane protein n=2 Tax=Deinococcus aerius TaxID=200253 RepID=A0A2I9E0G9_9DEIO|nr:hypothetical protein DAERI_110147 [Deinococcus aerius]